MVYRIAGVYRRRIDEILPFFPRAELREEPDETVIVLNAAEPLGPNAEIRAMPAGFYVHWWAKHPCLDRDLAVEGLDEPELRNVVFTHIGRWTEQLYAREMYADFGRKTGDLTVGRFRLVPFAADPALSVRLIEEGLDEVATYRGRVEALLKERLKAFVAERAKATPRT